MLVAAADAVFAEHNRIFDLSLTRLLSSIDALTQAITDYDEIDEMWRRREEEGSMPGQKQSG